MGVETLEPVIRRFDRKNDERRYQPRLHSRRIHQLYELGQELKLPMTVLLDQAVELFTNQISDREDPKT